MGLFFKGLSVIIFLIYFLSFAVNYSFAIMTNEYFTTKITHNSNWQDITNILNSSNSQYASVVGSGLTSAGNIGAPFDIPIGATIKSVSVKIYQNSSGNSGSSNGITITSSGVSETCLTSPSFLLNNATQIITFDSNNCERFSTIATVPKLNSGHFGWYMFNSGTKNASFDAISMWVDYSFTPTPPISGLTPGDVWEWVDATSTPIKRGGLSDIVEAYAGSGHSLALKKDGTVWAWGNNDSGQLGIGTISAALVDPVQVKAADSQGYLTDVKAITTGIKYSMALKNDGTVWVWGENGSGARGTGIGNGVNTVSKLLIPTQVRIISEITAIAAGDYHSLALKSDGGVFAWGWNDQGQTGTGYSVYSSIVRAPTKVLEGVKSIAAGGMHSLAVKIDGDVWGWGRLEAGQLGPVTNGWANDIGLPTLIPGINGIKSIWAKDNTSMALTEGGVVLEWGSGRYLPYDASPKQIPVLPSMSAIAGGSSSLVKAAIGAGVTENGEVWIWDAQNSVGLSKTTSLSNIGAISIGRYGPNLAVVKMSEATPTVTPTPTPTPTPKTPLILIPGMAGSEFKVSESFSSEIRGCGISPVTFNYNIDDLVWIDPVRAVASPCDEYLDVLKLKIDGLTPEYPQVVLNGNFFGGAYDNFIKFFTDNGYEQDKDLFIFPYDWRKDISVTKLSLDDKINQIKTQTGSEKVDIVAHSMGGLVARNYISDSIKAQNVRKLFTLGTPHLGSVKSLKALRYGDCLAWGIGPLCFSISPKEIKDIVQNMISAYQLIPSEKYSYFYNGQDNEHLRPYLINGQSFNYDQIKLLLTSWEYNTSLFSPSESLHVLDNNLENTNGVDVSNIAGSGLETLGQIREKKVKGFSDNTVQSKDGFSVNGDKTVPLFSASLNDPGNSLSLFDGAKVFYTNQDHGELVVSGPALNLVRNILNDDIQLPDGVSRSPYSFSGTQISVHSPVNIHVYDSENRHTGPTDNGNFEANIPGSSYDTLDDAKFIFLSNDGNYNIKFEATDQGSFDFKIRKYEDDTISQEILYKDIPLTTLTRAEAQFDSSSDIPPIIQLDKNNNGIIQDIDPSSNLTGDAVFDQVPPQTDFQIYGTLGNNGWFKSDAIVTLNPQDGAGGSGILKTEYSLDDGQAINIYTEPFIISAEKINKLKFRSIDNAGNEEDSKEAEIKIDKTPPQIAIDTNPKILWPANNKMVNVKIIGSSSDVNLLNTKIEVTDEYNKIEPFISDFGQIIKLQASRNGNDLDGRKYIVKVVAEDLAGNIAQSSTDVVVPHDQGKQDKNFSFFEMFFKFPNIFGL